MRKLKIIIAMFMLMVTAFVHMQAITIAVALGDVPQRIVDGEAFIPIRKTAYLYNADVQWDSTTRSVHITFADGNISVVSVDGAGGVIEDGRAWIPYEYVAQIFAAGETYVPTVAFESSIPLDVAASLFAEVEDIWDADNGDLWGFPIHAPLMIADPITRHAVTNMPDPDGNLRSHGDVYVGILPDHVFISHTIMALKLPPSTDLT